MGGCSVMNCSNSAKKGFRMVRIPQDIRKRKLWLEKMNRIDWELGTEARVCEEHFTSDMWELSQSNRKKRLKVNAVPTIFPEPPLKKQSTEKSVLGKTRKKLTGQRSLSIPNIRGNCASDEGFVVLEMVVPANLTGFAQHAEEEPLNKKSSVAILKPQGGHQVSILRTRADPSLELNSETAVANTLLAENDLSESPAFLEDSALCDESVISQCHYPENEIGDTNETILENDNISSFNENLSSDAGNCTKGTETAQKRRIFPALTRETMIKIIDKQHKQIISMKNKLRSIRKQQSKREKNMHNVHKNVLEALFSEEQIRALISKYVGGGTGKVHKWSERTIRTALGLKFACGNSGYDELLRMGFPFPSQRTLRESLEIIKFPSDISGDIVDLLRSDENAIADESEEDCSLEFDEMAIASQEEYEMLTEAVVELI